MRDKLIELVKDILDWVPWGQISSHTAEEVADHLIGQDVIVEQGQWLYGDKMPGYPRIPYKNFNHYCSVCSNQAERFNGEEFLPGYCYHCGAKLDMEKP
jgi:6-phosphogluconate dehydrogenase (decarboxylating)